MMSYVLRNSGLSSIKFLCATLSHMSICARIVVAVTLHEVNGTPNAKTCAKRDNQSLQYTNCGLAQVLAFGVPLT